jgi:hypothetical protein
VDEGGDVLGWLAPARGVRDELPVDVGEPVRGAVDGDEHALDDCKVSAEARGLGGRDEAELAGRLLVLRLGLLVSRRLRRRR